MIRFLIDEQLPEGLADRLAVLGYEATHVRRLGLGGHSDEEVWSYAARIGAVLMTKDADFASSTRPPNRPSVVWVRVGNVTNAALWRSLEPRLQEIVNAIANGENLIQIDGPL